MKKEIVALVAISLIGLISSANAAVITGTQSFSYSDAAVVGNGLSPGFTSGSLQALVVGGETVAEIGVNSYQDINVVGSIVNPVAVTQNGQTGFGMEVTDGKIAGLTFNAKEGSALEFASLGAEHVDSEMGGQAVAQTLCVGCDQQATLTDEACGNAAADQTNMKITGGVFGFDALASANLIFDDGCLEDEQQAVGMSVSSLANGVADTSCPDCEIPDLTEIEVSGDFTKTMTTVITDIDN